ncbi:MAG: fatty acid desaturase family protein [Janthinobacterium lividum]
MRDSGLLQRRRGYYWRRFAAITSALAGTVTLSWVIGDSWRQLLLAPLVALLITQIAFLGHDAAHRQIFTSGRRNDVASRVLSGLFAGLSHGWWLGKHNVHHAAPNQIGRDTDIHSKVLAFYPEAVQTRRGPHAWVLRRQGFLVFPLLLLEGFNLHFDSTTSLLRRSGPKQRWVELSMTLARWAVYVGLATAFMSTPKAITFIAVDLACFGVFLGGAFLPNHTGMPIVPKGLKVDFLHRQVLSSRNVSGGRVVEFFMGGLNHQVEHHLFPNMPRPNLRLVQPLVREFCATHSIVYSEATPAAAFAEIVRYLNRVGLGARRQRSCPLAAQLRGS